MDQSSRVRPGRKFALRIAIRAGLFVLAMFAVPLALYALDRSEGADVTVNEAIRLMTASGVGVGLYLLLVLSLIRPCWQRMKELQLSGYGSLLVSFLMLADLPFFIASPREGSYGFSLSTASGQIPFYLLAAIILIVGMALRPPNADQLAGHPLGLAGRAVVLLSVLMSLDLVSKLAFMKWMSAETADLGPEDAPSALFLSVAEHAVRAWSLSPLVCVALAGATAWCVVLSRRAFLLSGR